MHRVLWIEDGAPLELHNLMGPLIVKGEYDVEIALDATEAIRKISESTFDVIIVDIRIPPGSDKEWRELYIKLGFNKVKARLGLEILRSLFSKEEPSIKVTKQKWVEPKRFGVLTVENELHDELKALRIDVYYPKTARMPHTVLLDMVDRIIDRLRHDI